ncbi:MAG: cytochrome c-type biogenesis CcmF C-terminal domain-containing protein, partial [Solirubrobacterales bacterium]
RRYGGYIVHAGVAELLIGIAASSSFQTNRDVDLKPGESTTVDGYKVTYVRPTASVDKLAFTAGAVLKVTKGSESFSLHPTRNFYRRTGVPEGPTTSGYFGGESDSNVGLEAGLKRDFWVAEQPDITGVQNKARLADEGFKACVEGAPGTPPQCKAVGAMMRAAAANPQLRPAALAQIEKLQAITAQRIAQGYLAEGSTATFKVIVNPLVTWMWIGGLIALAGALIAIWPARSRRRGALVRTEADARKEAKYREIRDAELDHAAGKLSDEDFAVVDAELRREALEILGAGEANGSGNGHANGNGAHPQEPEKVEQS